MKLTHQPNRIFAADGEGNLLAEIEFPDVGEGLVHITHTFVAPSLRGQGIASQLVQAAAEQLRQQGKRALPVCSYAKAWFERHSEYADLLAQDR